MTQMKRLKRLEERRATLGAEDGGHRLLDFLAGLSDRLTGDEDATSASPAMVAALVIREGQMASPAILRRAEALSNDPGPVGKLFTGLLGGFA